MKYRGSKSGLFLMELIGVILIFAIASGVCVQLFVRAHFVSNDSTNLNMALTQMGNTETCLYGTKGDLEKVAELMDGRIENQTFVLYYNQDWEPINHIEDATFQLMVSENGSEEFELQCTVIGEKTVLLVHNIVVHKPMDRRLP